MDTPFLLRILFLCNKKQFDQVFNLINKLIFYINFCVYLTNLMEKAN